MAVEQAPAPAPDDGGGPRPGEHVATGEHVERTMGEHGRKTTIGGVGLELEPPGLPLRLKIGREVEGDPECAAKLGLRIVRTLAITVNRLGDTDLTKLSMAERVAHVGALAVVDMHYISLLHLAAEDAGKHRVTADAGCPRCKKKLPQRILVDLLKVRLHAYEHPPTSTYRFADPFWMLGLDVEELRLGPPSVSRAFESMLGTELGVDILRDLSWAAAAITHVNGQPMRVSADALADRHPETGRGMTDRDWDGLKEAFNDAFGHVDAAARYRHDCGEELWVPIDWLTVFFGRSRG